MKILPLLTLISVSSIVLSEETESNEKGLLERASAQLERLAPYRRASTDQRISNEQWQLLDYASKDPTSRTAFEIYKLLPENLQNDVARRIGASRATIELLGDPKYMAMMQERIKRSGSKREIYEHGGYDHPPDGYPHEEYGGYGHEEYGEHHPESSGSDSGGILKGSGSLFGGIAKGLIGGLVSASGSASKGSSSISASSSSQASSSSSSSSDSGYKKPEYGQAYSYGDHAFDVWDFKKAIISTLMQAVKAISGGVIALKGQLIKGSGYLVSTKGKIMTKTGDAITNLGRNIAKSAVHQPHHEPPHHGYSYDHPPEIGHDEAYEGPPPSIEQFGEHNNEYHGSSNYESPSDVDDQAGLLIVKPTKSDEHKHHTVGTDSQNPPLTQPENSYHGPPPGLPEKDVENSVMGNNYQNYDQENHNVVDSGHIPDHPPSSYEVPIKYQFDEYTKGQDYPIYPPLDSKSPINLHNPFSIQQSVEYPPIHVQYTIPNKGSFDLPNGDAPNNDLSVYSSFTIGGPEIESIKISNLKPGNGFEFPKLQPQASPHDLPLLQNYASLQGPLKIPLLKPLVTPYWQNQGLLQPYANFDVHNLYRRRSSAQRRRSISDYMHRMRLRRG